MDSGVLSIGCKLPSAQSGWRPIRAASGRSRSNADRRNIMRRAHTDNLFRLFGHSDRCCGPRLPAPVPAKYRCTRPLNNGPVSPRIRSSVIAASTLITRPAAENTATPAPAHRRQRDEASRLVGRHRQQQHRPSANALATGAATPATGTMHAPAKQHHHTQRPTEASAACTFATFNAHGRPGIQPAWQRADPWYAVNGCAIRQRRPDRPGHHPLPAAASSCAAGATQRTHASRPSTSAASLASNRAVISRHRCGQQRARAVAELFAAANVPSRAPPRSDQNPTQPCTTPRTGSARTPAPPPPPPTAPARRSITSNTH